MRTAGIREARQNLSVLIEHVKNGQEVTITERGKPVAVLSRPKERKKRGLPDLSAFRRSLKSVTKSVSEAIIAERNESSY